MDENRDSVYDVNQFVQCILVLHSKVSPRVSDTFRPQKISPDFSIAPLKEQGESNGSLRFPSSELRIPHQNIFPRKASIHVKKVTNTIYFELNKTSDRLITQYNQKESKSHINQKESPYLWRMVQKEKLIRKFLEKLKKQAHILPKKFSVKSQNFFTERYLENKNLLVVQENSNKMIQGKNLVSFQTLNPTGIFALIWNFLRAIQLMLLMWWLPFKVAFRPHYVFSIDVIETSLIFIFAADIIIKLNTGFIKEGELVSNRIDIFKHYIQGELYEDTIYFITQLFVFNKIDLDLEMQNEVLVFIQFLLNFAKLKKQVTKYEEMFATKQLYIQIVDLIQLIILVFYFAHFMACIWYYVGVQSLYAFDMSWTTKPYLLNSNILTYYLYSFYWAITTMVTVGYGDISAQNSYEVLCATISMIFSTGMFAFVINQIGAIFNNLDAEKQNYKRTLLLINEYMKRNSVDSSIQSRIRNYLKYQGKIKMQSQNEEIDQILQKLPSNIRGDLQKNIQSKIMSETKFYKSNFSSNVIPLVSQSLQIQCFTPKEIIFQSGQLDDCSLFTVWKGEVSIVENLSGKVLATLGKGESFGEIEFLTSDYRYFTAISKDFSQVLKMPREKFLKIIKNSELDFEQFHKLKDQYILNNTNGISKCYCCSENHILNQCPIIHYMPNKDRILRNYNMEEVCSSRLRYNRQNKRKTFFQFQSYQSETSDKNNNNNINRQETFKNAPQLSIKNQEEVMASKGPIRSKTKTHTIMNLRKITGSLFHIEEEKQSDNSPFSISNVDPFNTNNESNFLQHRVSQDAVLGIPVQKNKLSLSNALIVTQSFNQLDQIQQEYLRYFSEEIDLIKSFSNYFPQNNIEVVLLNYKKHLRMRRQVKSESHGDTIRRNQFRLSGDSIRIENFSS